MNKNISTFGIISKNPCKAENNKFLPERSRSTILDVCAWIFSKVACSLNERKAKVLKLESHELPGLVATYLDPILKDARLGNLINLNPANFIVETIDSTGRRYCVRNKSSNDRSSQQEVDLIKSTCDCKRWQDTGIPCTHVLLLFLHRRLTLSELEATFHLIYRMDNVKNDTTLTLTSFDKLVVTNGKLTMPDGGYSPIQPIRKRPMEKRRRLRWESNKKSKN